MAAPAVGKAVLEGGVAGAQQGAGGLQGRDDGGVGGEHLQAGERARRLGEHPGAVDGAEDLQTELAPEVEVLGAMPGGGVHAAGAGIQGDVATQHHRALARKQRVAVAQAGEVAAGQARQDVVGLQLGGADGGQEGLQPPLGHQHHARVQAVGDVDQIGPQGHGDVGGQGPGGWWSR